MMRRELTGRDVLIGFVLAFGVIIAVNLTLAWKAVATFPGLEVKNSYVASQTFDAERAAQERLGWTTDTTLDGDVIRVAFSGPGGQAADVDHVEALLGRTTVRSDDQTLVFIRTGVSTFEAPVAVAKGQWMMQLRAIAADGTPWRSRVSLAVN